MSLTINKYILYEKTRNKNVNFAILNRMPFFVYIEIYTNIRYNPKIVNISIIDTMLANNSITLPFINSVFIAKIKTQKIKVKGVIKTVAIIF